MARFATVVVSDVVTTTVGFRFVPIVSDAHESEPAPEIVEVLDTVVALLRVTAPVRVRVTAELTTSEAPFPLNVIDAHAALAVQVTVYPA